jgi:hypothetical protein
VAVNYIKFFIILNVVKPSTINITKLNVFSTVFSDSFLLKCAPRNPPIIAAITITITTVKSKSENPFVKKIVVSFENCENRIVIKEQIVAVLIGIEKRKTITVTFIGPPPIPKKAEHIPKTNPVKREDKIPLSSLFLNLLLLFI